MMVDLLLALFIGIGALIGYEVITDLASRKRLSVWMIKEATLSVLFALYETWKMDGLLRVMFLLFGITITGFLILHPLFLVELLYWLRAMLG